MHDLAGHLPLDLRLDRADNGRRIGGPPGRVLAVRLVEPGREIDDAGLLDETPVIVVDPMARERARAEQAVVRRPICTDRQLERRPRERRPELDIRLPRHGTRRRETHPTSDGLDEPDRRWSDLRVLLDIRHVHGRKADRSGPDPHGCRANVSAAEIAVADDPAILDIDERPELVGFAETVGLAQVLEVDEPIRWRLVVVGHTELEGDLRQAFDRLGWDPRHCGDTRLVSRSGHGRASGEW